MFEIIKKLIMARQISFEEGFITILGQPVTMQPIVIWVSLQKYLEKEGSAELMYHISKDTCKAWLTQLRRDHHMSVSDLINWGVHSTSFAGWGKASIANYDAKNKRAIIHVQDSTFAKSYGRSKQPVDQIMRGFLAGAGCVYFDDETIECAETKCMSTGDTLCEFIVKRAKDFEDSELVRKQLPFLFKQKS